MACAAIESFSDPAVAPAEWQDADLVSGILADHEGCFDALHARYRGRIYGFALNRLADPAEAEDVTQEVFLQVHRSLASFEGRSSLLTWMFGIAHNQVCRRFRRKRPPMLSFDDLDRLEVCADECPADRRLEAARMLRRCGEVADAELSPSQRRIFYLRYADNCSNRSIAQQLGKSNQAVKISLFRTRRTLARHAPELPALLG
jgi:RNA polymerase sigma-70 factor (ECF subfamily)